MLSTTTLDELAEKLLGADVSQVFRAVDVKLDLSEQAGNTLSLDDLSRKYLSPEVNQAFPKVNLAVETLGVGIEAKELRMYFHMRGLSLLIILLTLVSLAIGADPMLTLLRTLLGG
jgi:hypothetical protein